MRPVRFVSPFAAGGNTDMVGRAIAPRLAERIGQNVIVENRPGAGGIIGTASVAKGTPDGHSRLALSRFLAPPVAADHRNAPVNALGYLRVMFAVDDLDATLERIGKLGAELVGEVVQYGTTYRLCYIRAPDGLLIGLAQQLG